MATLTPVPAPPKIDRRVFTWRDLLIFALAIFLVVVSFRAEHGRANIQKENRQSLVLVAGVICSQSKQLISASQANATDAQKRKQQPAIDAYLAPLNEALSKLNSRPCGLVLPSIRKG